MEDKLLDFDSVVGFEWDKGNKQKNWENHQVHYTECEQVFFNKPSLIGDDPQHSTQEKSYYVLGRSDVDRTLFIVFTIRRNKIRVISARDQSKKEREIYEQQQ
ncbi:MAG: BrnT family toxin [Ktedonobacteraceae bacterium]